METSPPPPKRSLARSWTWYTPSARARRDSRETVASNVPFAEGFHDQHALNEAILHDPDHQTRRWVSKCLFCSSIAAFIVAVPIIIILITLQSYHWCPDCFQRFANDPLDVVGQIIAGAVFALCLLVLVAVGLSKLGFRNMKRPWGRRYIKDLNA